MESPIDRERVARLAAQRVTNTMVEGHRAEFDALPLQMKLAISHEALECSVSHLAINRHRTSGRLFGA